MVAVTYAVAFALATVFSLAVTWEAIRARPRQGADWLALTMAGVTWWSLMEFLQTLVPEYGRIEMVFTALHWIGVGVVAIGVLGVGLSLSGRGERITPRLIAVLSLIPAVTTLVWLGDARVVDLLVITANLPASIVWVLMELNSYWSWFEWIALVYLYGLVAIGSVFVLETAYERPTRDPARVLLGVMIGAPLVVNLGSELDLIPYPGYDPTVLGFVVTGIAGIVAIDRFRLFDIPLARSQLVEQLSTPVLVYGHDYRLYDYNQAAMRLLSLGSDDINEDIRDVLTDTAISVPAPVLEADADLADTLHGTVVSIPGENDDTRRFLVDVSPLASSSPGTVGYAIQLSDITTQYRQRERLKQQNERLDEFAGIVSHDLQNPLHVAMGRLQLARSEYESEHLDDVASAHDRMKTLIEDLLALAREGTVVEKREAVEVTQLAESCWRTVETEGSNLVFDTEFQLRADPRRLRQLFENLFRNAVEHSPNGVTITIGTIDGGFYVEDDGPGIPKNDQEAVFEKGYSTSKAGQGLGLSIVKAIVEDHGWEITVVDSEAGGARFEITGVEMN